MTKQKKKMENACVKDKKAFFLYIRIWMRKNTSSLIQKKEKKKKFGRNVCLK